MMLRNANKTQQQQLETRQAQLLMGIYQFFYSQTYTEHEYILTHYEVKNYSDWVKAMENKEYYCAHASRHAYLEGIGIMVKQGLLDIQLVAQLMSGPVRWFWEHFEAITLDVRKEMSWPRFMIEVEYLYNALNSYAESHPELQIATPSTDIRTENNKLYVSYQSHNLILTSH